MVNWNIGCSGYQYSDWKRIFYPEELPEKKWFEFYAGYFNSLELNVTFYRAPKPPLLRSWYTRTPNDFLFSVKAPRLITHFKRLHEAQVALNQFYEALRHGLAEKAGCVLFQFPSSFVYEEHRLERIVNLVDPSWRNVVEFRHESWWKEEVFSAFRSKNITFCGMSHPRLPNGVVQTSDAVYYRFQGVPHLYTSSYSTPQLENISQQIQSLNVKDAFIFFNNTADGAAVNNARQFREICEAVSH